MIRSETRRSTNRCFLSVLLILGLTVPMMILKAGDAEAKGARHWLKEIREGQFEDHCSLVFVFGKDFSFTPPVVQESETLITFGDAGTALPPLRNLRSFNSMLRLEKKDDGLEARIATPKDFPRVTYNRAKGPTRLIVRFNRGDGTAVSSAAANSLPGGILKAQDAIGIDRVGATPVKAAFRDALPGENRVAMASAVPDPGVRAPSAQNTEIAKTESPPETLQRRSYNYLDLDIRQALSALAQDQEVNVVMSSEVAGKISVHLNQVTLEEAIRSIALAGGLTYRKEGGHFYVYKPKLIADPQAERLQIRVFRMKFAAIDKVQEIISAFPGMRTVRLHEPTKTVIVEDTPENIAKIETLLRSWDLAPLQVLIEAKIMQVTLTDDMSMGVEWQKVFGNLTYGTTGFVVPGAGLTANLLTAAGTRDQFTAAIQALQAKTQVNTLSTPKILALHGKPSRVQVGGRQGYKTSTVTLGVVTEAVSFLDTGTILDITPYIDDSGNVLLDVKPQINSVTFDATGTPNQKTTTVSTSMMAKSGQTIFIGGLIEDTKIVRHDSVPCLGGIPGLGLLFGQMRDGINKSELIVLITPQIIDLEARSDEAIEKTHRLEESLKNEPLPLKRRLLDVP